MSRKTAKLAGKRGQPRKTDARRHVLQVRIRPADLAALDAARGDQTRSSWVYALIQDRLVAEDD